MKFLVGYPQLQPEFIFVPITSPNHIAYGVVYWRDGFGHDGEVSPPLGGDKAYWERNKKDLIDETIPAIFQTRRTLLIIDESPILLKALAEHKEVMIKMLLTIYRNDDLPSRLRYIIKLCREVNVNYPEFKVIEKSMGKHEDL